MKAWTGTTPCCSDTNPASAIQTDLASKSPRVELSASGSAAKSLVARSHIQLRSGVPPPRRAASNSSCASQDSVKNVPSRARPQNATARRAVGVATRMTLLRSSSVSSARMPSTVKRRSATTNAYVQLPAATICVTRRLSLPTGRRSQLDDVARPTLREQQLTDNRPQFVAELSGTGVDLDLEPLRRI